MANSFLAQRIYNKKTIWNKYLAIEEVISGYYVKDDANVGDIYFYNASTSSCGAIITTTQVIENKENISFNLTDGFYIEDADYLINIDNNSLNGQYKVEPDKVSSLTTERLYLEGEFGPFTDPIEANGEVFRTTDKELFLQRFSCGAYYAGSDYAFSEERGYYITEQKTYDEVLSDLNFYSIPRAYPSSVFYYEQEFPIIGTYNYIGTKVATSTPSPQSIGSSIAQIKKEIINSATYYPDEIIQYTPSDTILDSFNTLPTTGTVIEVGANSNYYVIEENGTKYYYRKEFKYG